MDGVPFDWVLTQGVLGFTTAVALYICSRLWQKLEAERAQRAIDMDAKERAHKLELAEWQKLYTASTEQRIAETNLHANRVAEANSLVREIHFNRGGPRLEQAS